MFSRRLIEQIGEITSGQMTTLVPYNSGDISTSQTAISSNTIRLDSSASATNNYYVDYDIILNKVLPNGTTHTQKKRIVAYNGSTKTAVIDDIWDIGFEPAVGDSYNIVLSYPDKRVSINPVMQTADYVTSVRYGRGLDPEKDFFLNTWIDAARKCDAKSDVSLKTTASVSVNANDVYRLVEGSRLVWEGTIRETRTSQYILFTDVLGKITHRWNSWKYFQVGDIIYKDSSFYRVTTAGVKSTFPGTGTTVITSLAVNRVAGTGPLTLSLSLTRNPVLALNEAGEEISGYTLYDADSIDYWRRLGWDEHSQSAATLYQTNFTIDTSTPMFDNINMMLEHYNGIFSYSEGRYTLAVEEAEATYIPVSEEDIIGKISFEDSGSKSAYNSVSVSYSDPGNNFESRNISLFSETFLKQDRNVPKKGNITVTGITNYYNVRLLADTYLKKSRFNSTISLTLFPEFISLVAGSVIGLTYKRFNWTNKPFRVDTITINPNGTVNIVADEYNDNFYSLTNMNKVEGVGNRNATSYTAIPAPSNLKATSTLNNNQLKDGILITWDNAPALSNSTQTQIYSSDSNIDTLSISSITANYIDVGIAHDLLDNSRVIATASGNGIIKDKTYFVSLRDANTFYLSETPGGAYITLTSGTSSATLSTYTLVGEVTYPERSFLHPITNLTESTNKYYKVRYKAQK